MFNFKRKIDKRLMNLTVIQIFGFMLVYGACFEEIVKTVEVTGNVEGERERRRQH